MWTARAINEIGKAEGRTWFCTLTFNWATKDMSTRSEQWRYAARSLTLYMKRLRKQGLKFRYLAVFEAHKSGKPHIHLLLHEMCQTTYRKLKYAWTREGFGEWKIIKGDEPVKIAGYVTKYLFKDRENGLCRVRASVRYGQTAEPMRTNSEPVDTDRDYSPLWRSLFFLEHPRPFHQQKDTPPQPQHLAPQATDPWSVLWGTDL